MATLSAFFGNNRTASPACARKRKAVKKKSEQTVGLGHNKVLARQARVLKAKKG